MANNNDLPPEYYAMLVAEAEAAAQGQQAAVPVNIRQAAINAEVAEKRANYENTYRRAPGLTNQEHQIILNQLLQSARASRNAAKESSAEGLYSQAEGIFKGETAKLRPSVLLETALDDIVLEQGINLNLARTNQERRAAATKKYNAEALRAEIYAQREQGMLPTAEQAARFANLTEGINLNSLPVYPRLVAFNKSMKNKAATNISKIRRGYTTRKQYGPQLNALRAAREAAKRRAEQEAIRRARLARFNKKPGQGGKRRKTRRNRK